MASGASGFPCPGPGEDSELEDTLSMIPPRAGDSSCSRIPVSASDDNGSTDEPLKNPSSFRLRPRVVVEKRGWDDGGGGLENLIVDGPPGPPWLRVRAENRTNDGVRVEARQCGELRVASRRGMRCRRNIVANG